MQNVGLRQAHSKSNLSPVGYHGVRIWIRNCGCNWWPYWVQRGELQTLLPNAATPKRLLLVVARHVNIWQNASLYTQRKIAVNSKYANRSSQPTRQKNKVIRTPLCRLPYRGESVQQVLELRICESSQRLAERQPFGRVDLAVKVQVGSANLADCLTTAWQCRHCEHHCILPVVPGTHQHRMISDKSATQYRPLLRLQSSLTLL